MSSSATDLSLRPVVEQFAEDGSLGQDALYRLPGGNDTLPRALHERLRSRVMFETIVRTVRQSRDGVRAIVLKASTQPLRRQPGHRGSVTGKFL